MKELENHHNQETIKYDKTAKLQCKLLTNLATMNFSKVSNASSMSRALKVRNFWEFIEQNDNLINFIFVLKELDELRLNWV